jgi:hypothetical protein
MGLVCCCCVGVVVVVCDAMFVPVCLLKVLVVMLVMEVSG